MSNSTGHNNHTKMPTAMEKKKIYYLNPTNCTIKLAFSSQQTNDSMYVKKKKEPLAIEKFNVMAQGVRW